MSDSSELLRARLHARSRVTHWPRWQRLLWRPWHRLKIASKHLWVGLRPGSGEVVARTFWGEPMTVILGEPVSEQLLRHGFFEEGLSRMLIEYLRPGMTVFDVGAHFGYDSLLAARLVGPNGRVYAFEPMPATFELLARNTRTHANIERIESAVFSRSGTLTMTDHGPRSSAFASFTQPRAQPSAQLSQPRTFDVAATTLDDFCAALSVAPQFVKIDVESAEAHVLQGMRTVIEQHHPAISLEVGDFGIPTIPPSRQLVDELIGYGYTAYEYGSPQQPLRPHARRDTYDYDNLFFLHQTVA